MHIGGLPVYPFSDKPEKSVYGIIHHYSIAATEDATPPGNNTPESSVYIVDLPITKMVKFSGSQTVSLPEGNTRESSIEIPAFADAKTAREAQGVILDVALQMSRLFSISCSTWLWGISPRGHQ